MIELDVVKKIASVVAAIGISAIVNNAIKSTTPSTAGLLIKACICVGGMVIAGIISEKAETYVGEAIDIGVKDVKEILAELN